MELLAVIAIVSLLAATSSSILPSLMQADQVDANVSALSGILEQAREAALSRNTFVYVLFTGPLTSPSGGVGVAVVESQDGTDSLNNFSYSGPINASNGLTVVRKLQTLPAIKLLTQAQTESRVTSLSMASVPVLSAPGAALPASLNLTLNVGGSPCTFTQGVMFKPDGQVMVSTSAWNSSVEFGIESIRSSSPNIAVMRLTRLTGKLSVYRQ